MMAIQKKLIIILALVIVLFSCTLSKISSKEGNISQNVQRMEEVKTDTSSIDTIKKGIRPYNEVITNKAITQNGLFKVHKVNEKYYFEIADSILSKDILIVNRISKAAADNRPFFGFFGYAGDYIGENVVRFVKGPAQKLFIERVSYLDISHDSSQNGMYRSVLNSNLPTIHASFDIKAFSPDSIGLVIDMTDFINGDNNILFFPSSVKDVYKLGAIQADKSYIQGINSFPLNTEIKTVKTFVHDKELLTYELNSSLVLLPSKPMKPRYYDERVGYFAREYRDFDAPGGIKDNFMITRWRLEPKEDDIQKYRNAELVEPKKPIVFYIDPATPKKWVPYLIQGVNDWQRAFEKAGFKNAIYAIEAPANDSTWSLDDARHNAIVYKASDLQNASGPQISDPRSGEILESHINWYHNVQQILHDWYMIQAGPNDPKARKMEFDDSLMGQLIRYVCTHEVGHTLGLQHNFAASSTIPVDSLRNSHYVAINGHTPSIMDYARFNYVAQPEDKISPKDLIPRIGVYDEWAIEWGYSWLPGLKTKDEENVYLKKWIVQRLTKDKRLFFEEAKYRDVRNRMEDLGDDAVKVGDYGIRNLKLVMSHLVEWTKSPSEDYSRLKRMNDVLLGQYKLYIDRVARNIAGEYVNPKTGEQDGTVFNFLDKEKQRAAVQFLQKQLFDTPEWLFNKEIFSLSGDENVIALWRFQEYELYMLVFPMFTYNALIFNETNQSAEKVYHFDELLTDLEDGIWKELNGNNKIDLYRRHLQKTYVFELVHNGIRLNKYGDFSMTDFCTIVNDHIKQLVKKINSVLPRYTDPMSKSHLLDMLTTLNQALDFQKKNFPERPGGIIPGPRTTAFGPGEVKIVAHGLFPVNLGQDNKSCWENENNWKEWGETNY
ncbi:MAG: zinc-dependent metalloprotease [Bacteroidota bacterium]|nr:zinc-dependent metalloprotease [Bacteroidota bacterium]